jgi:hypothetical protein
MKNESENDATQSSHNKQFLNKIKAIYRKLQDEGARFIIILHTDFCTAPYSGFFFTASDIGAVTIGNCRNCNRFI